MLDRTPGTRLGQYKRFYMYCYHDQINLHAPKTTGLIIYTGIFPHPNAHLQETEKTKYVYM